MDNITLYSNRQMQVRLLVGQLHHKRCVIGVVSASKQRKIRV